eukprot:s2517_g4.t1
MGQDMLRPGEQQCRVESGAEHAWVLTREGYGTITFWEATTGAKFHLAQRWFGKTDERSIPEVDQRYNDRQATADWKSEAKLAERADFSRQQHLASMDQLYRLPIAPWTDLYSADAITAVPYASIEVVFNGFNVYGNKLNHHPGCIFYDMEIASGTWEVLCFFSGWHWKDVAIPVGAGLNARFHNFALLFMQKWCDGSLQSDKNSPKVSSHTAETLERNIENKLKESIRMIRMRIGFESAYEDSEVRDEALRAYLLHLEKECVLDSDWAYDDQDLPGWFIDQGLKPWGAPSPFNASEYKTPRCPVGEAWGSHWQEKKKLKTARQYLAVKENHVLSGVPLHFSSTDLKEIAGRSDREAALWAEEQGIDEMEDEEDMEPTAEDLKQFGKEEPKAEEPPPEVKDEGQDLYATEGADKKLEELEKGGGDDEKKKKKDKKEKKAKESE